MDELRAALALTLQRWLLNDAETIAYRLVPFGADGAIISSPNDETMDAFADAILADERVRVALAAPSIPEPSGLVAALRALPRYVTPDGEEAYLEWAAVRDLIGDDDGPVEAAALALADSRQKKEHGQLCPVWTQRVKKVRHAATIADCDCWILPDARRDAAIVVAALRAAPSTPEPSGQVDIRGAAEALGISEQRVQNLMDHDPSDDTDPRLRDEIAAIHGSLDRIEANNRLLSRLGPAPSTEPALDAERLATIHRPVTNPMYPRPICEDDGQEWPCKTAIVARLAESQP